MSGPCTWFAAACATLMAAAAPAPGHGDASVTAVRGAWAHAAMSCAPQDDSALLQCASEQGWRELVDALERIAPPRTDDAKAAFGRARLRIDATDPRRSSADRAASWVALDAAHARRIASALDSTSRREAVAERGTDALRIGLFAEPCTASALASADPADVANALALLRTVEESTRQDVADGARDGTGRTIAFLHVASQALQTGIDRADRGGAASRDRRARAAALLERVRAQRDGIPPSLSAIADLAECAAASAAGDADAARAAAVRIVYLGEPLPAMFGRILVCDALAESRMGDRALAELVQVIRVDGLSLPLRILAADAYVRLRDSLGKSSLAAPTFEAYGEVVRRSSAQDRWPARLAVIERLGPITARAVDTSWLPPEGLVARAYAQRVAGDASAGSTLRSLLGQEPPEDAALAAIASLDAAVRARDSSLAADALRALAIRFDAEAPWPGCALELAQLEVAHDASKPRSRPAQMREAVTLAVAVDSGSPAARMLTAAQQAAQALDLARAKLPPPSEAAERLSSLQSLCAGSDPAVLAGTRTLAAMLVLDACALDPASADIPVRTTIPDGLTDMHPSDARLVGAALASRAIDAAGSPIAAAAAARLRAIAPLSPAATHAARGARSAIESWLNAPADQDAMTAQGLAAVLDAAAAVDPADAEAMRLAVRLARRWGSLSPTAAADRSARARAASAHAAASRDDLLALADALLDEGAMLPPSERTARIEEAMSVARLAESLAPRGSSSAPAGRPVDWGARERMVRAARLAGREEEANAHMARLAAIDPTLGGSLGSFGER